MKYLPVFILVLLAACGDKNKTTETTGFISVKSLIEQQVAHVDTSLYSIIRISFRDTSHYDTAYIPRENFRQEARDFLDIPDLADPKVAKRYREETPQYDEQLNRVIITYRPIDMEKETVKKQEILVTPASATGDRINNVLLLREISNRDSFMKQDMLWIFDRSFQITTTTQKPGQPEVTTVTRVIWNADE